MMILAIFLASLWCLPVILAIIGLIMYRTQVEKWWWLLLGISFFSGVMPLVAAAFLIVNYKVFTGRVVKITPIDPPSGANASASPTAPAQPMQVYPDATRGQFASDAAAPAPITPAQAPLVTPRRAGTVFGSIVAVVLWASGLAAVGVFVVVTVALIQCSNDPKCI